jgi:hypothetical protein
MEDKLVRIVFHANGSFPASTAISLAAKPRGAAGRVAERRLLLGIVRVQLHLFHLLQVPLGV